MTRKLKIICIVVTIAIVFCIVALTFINKKNSIKKENDSEIMVEESVNLLIIEPDFLNPLVSKNKYVQEISKLVFDGLVKIGKDLKPEFSLAKTFLPNENLTTWNVTLRDDVYFHDSSKFTADDVIFTINKIKELGDSSYFAYNVENINSVERISDYEVCFKLKEADNFLANKMNLPILSKRYYSNKSLEHTNVYIGTGLYKQAEVSDSNMKLSAFQDYYSNVTGNIKNVNVKIIEKSRTGFELLKLGEIDFADTNIDVGAYGKSAYNDKKYVTSVFEGIVFNPENEVLKDTSVRQAILLGINRDVIIENYLGGHGVSADLPINTNSYLVNKNLNKNSFNPERAQDILTNDSWKFNELLGCRTKGMLKLQLNLLINSNNKNAKEKAEFIKENLKNIGFDINVISKDTTLYNTAIAEKDYDMVITDWAVSEYPEFLYNFESNSKNNIFGFSNEDYDYYVFMAKTEFLEGKTKEYFDRMQEILIKELPMVGIYFETSTVYYNQKIEGELSPTINNIYAGLENMIKK